MTKKIKPLHQQTIFITGATSAVGKKFVKMAVEQGAMVFLVSHFERDLIELQTYLEGNGYESAYAIAHPFEKDQLQLAADTCIQHFGGIDTWVNLEVVGHSFWGVANGSQLAQKIMEKNGGVLINVGNPKSFKRSSQDKFYQASLSAVKTFSQSLRRELKHKDIPVFVSFISPITFSSAVLGNAPELLARAILRCALKPRNNLRVNVSPLWARLSPGNEFTYFLLKKRKMILSR